MKEDCMDKHKDLLINTDTMKTEGNSSPLKQKNDSSELSNSSLGSEVRDGSSQCTTSSHSPVSADSGRGSGCQQKSTRSRNASTTSSNSTSLNSTKSVENDNVMIQYEDVTIVSETSSVEPGNSEPLMNSLAVGPSSVDKSTAIKYINYNQSMELSKNEQVLKSRPFLLGGGYLNQSSKKQLGILPNNAWSGSVLGDSTLYPRDFSAIAGNITLSKTHYDSQLAAGPFCSTMMFPNESCSVLEDTRGAKETSESQADTKRKWLNLDNNDYATEDELARRVNEALYGSAPHFTAKGVAVTDDLKPLGTRPSPNGYDFKNDSNANNSNGNKSDKSSKVNLDSIERLHKMDINGSDRVTGNSKTESGMENSGKECTKCSQKNLVNSASLCRSCSSLGGHVSKLNDESDKLSKRNCRSLEEMNSNSKGSSLDSASKFATMTSYSKLDQYSVEVQRGSYTPSQVTMGTPDVSVTPMGISMPSRNVTGESNCNNLHGRIWNKKAMNKKKSYTQRGRNTAEYPFLDSTIGSDSSLSDLEFEGNESETSFSDESELNEYMSMNGHMYKTEDLMAKFQTAMAIKQLANSSEGQKKLSQGIGLDHIKMLAMQGQPGGQFMKPHLQPAAEIDYSNVSNVPYVGSPYGRFNDTRMYTQETPFIPPQRRAPKSKSMLQRQALANARSESQTTCSTEGTRPMTVPENSPNSVPLGSTHSSMSSLEVPDNSYIYEKFFAGQSHVSSEKYILPDNHHMQSYGSSIDSSSIMESSSMFFTDRRPPCVGKEASPNNPMLYDLHRGSLRDRHRSTSGQRNQPSQVYANHPQGQYNTMGRNVYSSHPNYAHANEQAQYQRIITDQDQCKRHTVVTRNNEIYSSKTSSRHMSNTAQRQRAKQKRESRRRHYTPSWADSSSEYESLPVHNHKSTLWQHGNEFRDFDNQGRALQSIENHGIPFEREVPGYNASSASQQSYSSVDSERINSSGECVYDSLSRRKKEKQKLVNSAQNYALPNIPDEGKNNNKRLEAKYETVQAVDENDPQSNPNVHETLLSMSIDSDASFMPGCKPLIKCLPFTKKKKLGKKVKEADRVKRIVPKGKKDMKIFGNL